MIVNVAVCCLQLVLQQRHLLPQVHHLHHRVRQSVFQRRVLHLQLNSGPLRACVLVPGSVAGCAHRAQAVRMVIGRGVCALWLRRRAAVPAVAGTSAAQQRQVKEVQRVDRRPWCDAAARLLRLECSFVTLLTAGGAAAERPGGGEEVQGRHARHAVSQVWIFCRGCPIC